MQPLIYSAYNPPPQVGEYNPEPSMTQQHFQDECDINNILAKFVKNGFLETVGPGYYDDVSDSYEYRQSIEILREAEARFADLPATVRKHFNNDPGAFMDFVHNPSNREKAIELGMIKKDANIQSTTDSRSLNANNAANSTTTNTPTTA